MATNWTSLWLWIKTFSFLLTESSSTQERETMGLRVNPAWPSRTTALGKTGFHASHRGSRLMLQEARVVVWVRTALEKQSPANGDRTKNVPPWSGHPST